MSAELTDDYLRDLWRKAGGEFFGPNIETGMMPEALLLPILRALAEHIEREAIFGNGDATPVGMLREPQTMRMVNASVYLPALCIHGIRLGQGTHCPACPP